MCPLQQQLITSTAAASAAGRIHFGEVLAALGEAGVESYQVDYRTARSTYYLADGDSLTLAMDPPEQPVAERFDAQALQAAIRGAQQGSVMYPVFKRMSQAAGRAS
jgi:uncharacterized protein YbcV (DUF1398 family)